MTWTQAVYYRDKSGGEPADEFINDLPAKRPAKIDAYRLRAESMTDTPFHGRHAWPA